MKKNIIFLLIDCFDYNKIGENKFRASVTPFLDSLKFDSYWSERMYSEAPYTEAALIATTCGYDTLDYGGHLKRYKYCPETLFEMMKRAGYEVYAQMWTHFYPTSAKRGIDVLQLRPYSFNTLWYYRFEYYSNLYKTGAIDAQDYNDIQDILDDNLIHWVEYFDLLISGDQKTVMVNKNMTLPELTKQKEILTIEINKYEKSKKTYIESILKEGLKHQLFQIYNKECLDNKVPEEFVEKVYSKYNYMNSILYNCSNRYNRKNNKLSLKKLWQYFQLSNYSLNLYKKTQVSQYLRNYWHITHDSQLKTKFGKNYPDQKDCITAKSMMNMFLEWADSRKCQDTPYFAYLHAEDIHGQSALFDICSQDEKEIDDQVNLIKEFVSSLPNNYRGSLTYDLGILNIDAQVKWFYNQLKEKGMLENTTLIITADHGCGTSYYPLRGQIQNFHDECYHVPFIIIDQDVTPIIDKRYHVTKDIMPTIAELIGVKPPKSSTGLSVFSEKNRKIVIQEYMGPGCPDMYRREAWMCAFDDEWKLFIKVKLNNEKGFDYKIEEIFNRRKDPLEVDNRKWNKKDVRECNYLLNALEGRWKEIIVNYSRDGKY